MSERVFKYASFYKRGSGLSHHGVEGPDFRVMDDNWNRKAAELEADRYQRAYDLGRQTQREADAALVEAAENWIESFLSENAPYKADGQLAHEIVVFIAAKIRGGA